MNERTQKELALPLAMDWVKNEGDYGSGPDLQSGFDSPVIVDANGVTILDTLNSDGASIEEDHDGDEDGSWTNAWDEAGHKRVEYIIAAVNAHDELVDALSGLVGFCALLKCNDLPAIVREALESNHRIVEARAVLARLGK